MRGPGRTIGLSLVLALLTLIHSGIVFGAAGSIRRAGSAHADTVLLSRARDHLSNRRFAAAESTVRLLLAELESKGRGGANELGTALDVLAEAIVRGSPRRAAEAVTVAARAVTEHEQRVGAVTAEVAASLSRLADGMIAANLPDSAITAVLERASAIHQRLDGPNAHSVSTVEWRMGAFLNDRGDYARGRNHLDRALAIRESTVGPTHPDVAEVLVALGMGYAGAGQPVRAKPMLERAASICESATGPSDPRLAKALVGLGYVDMMTGDGAGGRKRLERAIAIDSLRLEPDDVDLAVARRTLAAMLIVAGDGVRARRLAEQSVASLERTLGPEGPQLAVAIGTLAGAMAVSGERDEAIDQFTHAIPMLETFFGPDSPRLASARVFLGQLLGQGNDIRRARDLSEQGLSALERALGPEHHGVISARAALATALYASGDYSRARAILEAIIPAAARASDPDLAQFYTNLAVVELSMGDLTAARSHLERAIEIQHADRGGSPLEEAVQLANFGILLREMGDAQESRSFQERALAIRRRVLNARHPLIAASLSNLGALLIVAGDSAAARRYLAEAIGMLEGTDGPELAAALQNLALLARTPEELVVALGQMRRAATILLTRFGAEHPLVANCAQDLAVLLERTGEHAAAGREFERALAAREAALGPQHPLVARTRVLLGEGALQTGDAPEALKQSLLAEAIGRNHLEVMIRGLPESQALRFASVRNSGLDLALTLAGQGRVGGNDAARIWGAVIGARGLVLEEMGMRHRSAFAENDTTTAALGDSLRRATGRLANLSLRTSDANAKGHRERLEAAAADKRRFERLLGERSGSFRAREERRALGFAEVRAALPRKSALVAFAEYRSVAPRDAPALRHSSRDDRPADQLLAFVLLESDSVPRIVPLGESRPVDRLVSAWRKHAGGPLHDTRARSYEERACEAAGTALRRRVFDPVSRWLGGTEHLFVVPTGSLHLVNLGALPADSGRFMIELPMVIHYLSSERDLVPLRGRHPAGAGLLAMGGVNFDDTEAAPVATRRGSRGAAYRGARSQCAGFAELRFSPLRETVQEVREVRDIWAQRREQERPAREARAAESRWGRAATEGTFKLLAPGKRAIHLATHAFFLGKTCRSTDFDAAPAPGAEHGPTDPTPENPLLLSGLALAGANRRDHAGPESEDGILTAEEVSALDLSCAEWIVLSACETGLGVVESGEGVFGLRRAFSVAGARAVVMSLWKVEDRATRHWMRRLYAARFGEGLGTAEAVRAASLEYLDACRKRGTTTHPAGWGAFIAAENYRSEQ